MESIMDLWHCGSIDSQMTEQWLCSDTKHITHLAVSPAHLQRISTHVANDHM